MASLLVCYVLRGRELFVKSGALVFLSTQSGYCVSQNTGLVGVSGSLLVTAAVAKQGTASESRYGLAPLSIQVLEVD